GPFTHTGVHAGYPINDVVNASIWVINGWDVLLDTNKSPSLGAGVTLTPRGDLLTLKLLYLGGPEGAGTDVPWRHYLDLVAQLKPSKTVTLGANADYVSQDGASWYGVALYGSLATFSGQLLGVRGEVFADPDGVNTGL